MASSENRPQPYAGQPDLDPACIALHADLADTQPTQTKRPADEDTPTPGPVPPKKKKVSERGSERTPPAPCNATPASAGDSIRRLLDAATAAAADESAAAAILALRGSSQGRVATAIAPLVAPIRRLEEGQAELRGLVRAIARKMGVSAPLAGDYIQSAEQSSPSDDKVDMEAKEDEESEVSECVSRLLDLEAPFQANLHPVASTPPHQNKRPAVEAPPATGPAPKKRKKRKTRKKPKKPRGPHRNPKDDASRYSRVESLINTSIEAPSNPRVDTPKEPRVEAPKMPGYEEQRLGGKRDLYRPPRQVSGQGTTSVVGHPSPAQDIKSEAVQAAEHVMMIPLPAARERKPTAHPTPSRRPIQSENQERAIQPTPRPTILGSPWGRSLREIDERVDALKREMRRRMKKPEVRPELREKVGRIESCLETMEARDMLAALRELMQLAGIKETGEVQKGE
ncbi:hypothetical protein ACRE_076400 [Hapsidospora chrysogenum ATCC 11550]|uniref:Uncharacterized protein n=1 Tax=Hapsidospora chrysogenum (strain ATCC 11550 / CBS 779.69 / DSM 880 / IAM 14645 / JCM 23072 / IMI 49137) TaxID=857340 RepID=A0A086SX18_HAPC1|nr:hypothetical protein ACRE_076400 [Hapsidospora chrysogenum ATCC 11550]